MKYLRGILLPVLLALAPFAAAKKEAPTVVENPFPGELVNLFYFDDSEVALVAEYETGILHRSEDAGKTWKKQDFQTLGVIKSPYDNTVAIALGETEHYVTYDQGENWNRFETEWPPSWTGAPISFHATDNKKILFSTFEDMSGIGRVSTA